MVSLRFYGGVGEIGGNKFLVEDGNVRFWLDFGRSFSIGSDYYTGWLQPRSQNPLGDLFEFGLVPRIEGLYAHEHLDGTDLGHVEPGFDGVFVSHAHSDHVNHIGLLDPGIPIFLGSGTKLFMEAFEKTGSTKYGERDYRCFRTGDRISLGDVVVEPIHVDHSIPGAYGYIIHTSEGPLVYTGDLRAHGTRAEMTEEFLRRACELDGVTLISEGTRMSRVEKRVHLSEAQVLEGVREVCGGAGGRIVLYCHGPRDMDRLRTFYTAAVDYGRRLVVDTRAAYLLSRLVEDEHLDLPDPMRDDSVCVYYKRKRSGQYAERDYYIWEREFMDCMVTADDLRSRPSEFVVNLGFYGFAELIDIRPEPGSPFIYSMSEAFDEEDLEERVMHNWLGHFGLRYHQLHASGHLSREELVEAIDGLSTRRVFPVHTENPELFREHFDGVVVPVVGETYQL